MSVSAEVESKLKGWTLRSLVSVTNLTPARVATVLALADHLRRHPRANQHLLQGHVVASLFFEPSTRTACSFNAAMQRLGGRVIDISGESSSSVKGESLADTVRVLAGYADAIVMRHPAKGAAAEAEKALSELSISESASSSSPATQAEAPPIRSESARRCGFINAGDGTGEHPTQALLDIYTMLRELNTTSLDGKVVCMVGDLKHGRTVHSLSRLLAMVSPSVHLMYVSPPSLAMPQDLCDELNTAGTKQTVMVDLVEAVAQADVVYMTRVQKERFPSEAEYLAVKDSFIVTQDTMRHMKQTAVLMHPLPRVNEIQVEIDKDPRAAYFRQAENGMYVRMALLALCILGHE